MLTPFPDLLTYGAYAPTILRVVLALALFYIAYQQIKHRGKIAELKLPVSNAFASLSAILHAVVGLMVLVGYYTQWAVIIVAVALITGLWLNRRYPSVVILSNGTIVVLLAVCLSLLITGAGAYAFDLPL